MAAPGIGICEYWRHRGVGDFGRGRDILLMDTFQNRRKTTERSTAKVLTITQMNPTIT